MQEPFTLRTNDCRIQPKLEISMQTRKGVNFVEKMFSNQEEMNTILSMAETKQLSVFFFIMTKYC